MNEKIEPDKFIFLNETKNKKIMMEYIKAHEEEAKQNYGYDKESTNKEKKIMAEYIYTNYDTMKTKEMRDIVMGCMTEKKIRKELLEFELKYYVGKSKKMTLKEFTKKAKVILDRYQCKGGGYYIEDLDWTIHKSNSKEYIVKKHQILFTNSIDKLDKDDNETLHYLKRMVNRLNSLSEDIGVDYEIYDPDDGILWILIWGSHKKIKTPKISL